MSAEALRELDSRVAALERMLEGDGGRTAAAAAGPSEEDLLPGSRTGACDAQIFEKVSTSLQDFEAQITARLRNMQSDFDKKLSHHVKSPDSSSASTGLDMMTEDLDQLKYEMRELKASLGNKKSEDFAAAAELVSAELGEPGAQADGTHPVITSRPRFEATIIAEIAMMKLDIGDIHEALQNQDSQMEEVSNTMQQMRAKEENLNEDITSLKKKLDIKEEAKQESGAAIETARGTVSTLQLDVGARRGQVGEILATTRRGDRDGQGHGLAAGRGPEESKAKATLGTGQGSALPCADRIVGSFRRLDTTGSGMVSLAVLRQLVHMPEEMEAVISTTFADKHGLINFEHLTHWLCGCTAPSS